jgi:excisionase family DNA binding protein
VTLKRIAWSASEFAEMTGLSVDVVYDLLRAGDIPAKKWGTQWRIADAYVQAVQDGTVSLPERRAS